jgi:hypothetical protein
MFMLLHKKGGLSKYNNTNTLRPAYRKDRIE